MNNSPNPMTTFVGAVSLITGAGAVVALIAAFFVGGEAALPAAGLGFWSCVTGAMYGVFKNMDEL